MGLACFASLPTLLFIYSFLFIFSFFNADWNVKDDSINSFSCNQNQETPKLENFLEVGGQAFAGDHHKMIDGSSSHNMGLSMIKNWLRSHATPATAADDKPVDEAPPPSAAVGSQTLSLSMSTSSHSSDNKVCGGGAVESVPRKSIDTFGQRTSIYRGVTRFLVSYFVGLMTKFIMSTNLFYLEIKFI